MERVPRALDERLTLEVAALDAEGRGVARNAEGRLVFGNGITSARNAFGWTQFTNGVAIRRDYLGGRPDAFFVNPSLLCQEVTVTKAECKPR